MTWSVSRKGGRDFEQNKTNLLGNIPRQRPTRKHNIPLIRKLNQSRLSLHSRSPRRSHIGLGSSRHLEMPGRGSSPQGK